MDDPRELERLRNYKPSLDDLKMHDPYMTNKLKESFEMKNKWISVGSSKPCLANGFKALSPKVDVITPLGEGIGYYNHIDNNWFVELSGHIDDELQSYTGVTHWRYIE